MKKKNTSTQRTVVAKTMPGDTTLRNDPMAWRIADLCGHGFKQDELPALMMPFFALVLVDARLAHIYHKLRLEFGAQQFSGFDQNDRLKLLKSNGVWPFSISYQAQVQRGLAVFY